MTVPEPEPKTRSDAGPGQSGRTPASPRYGDFKPVPDGPPVDSNRSRRCFKSRRRSPDRIVVPTGLYVLGPLISTRADGRRRPRSRGSRSTSGATTWRASTHADAAATVGSSVDPGLANRPPGRSKGHLGKLSARRRADVSRPETRPTARTANTSPSSRRSSSSSAMNFARVGEGNFKDSFRTITVSATTPPTRALSDRHDWKARLGVPYLLAAQALVQNIKDAQVRQRHAVRSTRRWPRP